MRDLIDRFARLDLAINDPQAMFEKGRQMAAGEVAVFIDGGGEDGPAVLAIPAGIVRAPAEKRNSIRSSADDHSAMPVTEAGHPLTRVPQELPRIGAAVSRRSRI